MASLTPANVRTAVSLTLLTILCWNLNLRASMVYIVCHEIGVCQKDKQQWTNHLPLQHSPRDRL